MVRKATGFGPILAVWQGCVSEHRRETVHVEERPSKSACDECLRAGWKLATGTTRLDETGYWPLWHVVCEGTSP